MDAEMLLRGEKLEYRKKRQIISTADCKDIKNSVHEAKGRFTAEGLMLYDENKNTHECVKDFVLLNKKITDKKEIIIEGNVDSVDIFLIKQQIYIKQTRASKIM